MSEINWRWSILYQYRGKKLIDRNGDWLILNTNGIGQWEVKQQGGTLTFYSGTDACAWLIAAGAHEEEATK